MTFNNKKKHLIDKKPIYLKLSCNYGINTFKSKIVEHMYNNNIYNTYIRLNRLNNICRHYIKRYSTFNIGIDKINSKKYNKQRLKIVKKK